MRTRLFPYDSPPTELTAQWCYQDNESLGSQETRMGHEDPDKWT